MILRQRLNELAATRAWTVFAQWGWRYKDTPEEDPCPSRRALAVQIDRLQESLAQNTEAQWARTGHFLVVRNEDGTFITALELNEWDEIYSEGPPLPQRPKR